MQKIKKLQAFFTATAMIFLIGCAVLAPSPRAPVTSHAAYQAGRKLAVWYVSEIGLSFDRLAAMEAGYDALCLLTEPAAHAAEFADAKIDDAVAETAADLTPAQRNMAARFVNMARARLRQAVPATPINLPLLRDLRTGIDEALEDYR